MPDRCAVVRHYLPGGRESGGIGRLVGYIVDAAAQQGEVHAISDTRGPRWSAVRSTPRIIQSFLTLICDRIGAPERIHHIHVAGRGSTVRKLMLAALARTLGCTHVLHLHDYDYAADYVRRARWQQALVRRMFRSADRVVVLGERDRETMLQTIGVDAERVILLRNCVPDPSPLGRSPSNLPVILFIGRLGERKGVPELLSALAGPAMARLDWRAVLAGDGPVESYRREAERLGLGGRVGMPGWLDEVETRKLLSTADILVLPSRAEGMSMAVIEGLAHGLAVVTTRVGAHQEAITDDVSGVFVPVGDAMALGDALARLVCDAEARARLSSAGRKVYLQRFSMASYLRALRELYDGLRQDLPAGAEQAA